MLECTIKDEKCQGKCTGYNGSSDWKRIDKEIDKIGCETCRQEGHDLIDFAHDVKNVQLGKSVFKKANFHKYVKIVNCVLDSCLKEGKC